MFEKGISFFITAMQRTKRTTKLKILYEKKALINTKLGNAYEYVTVKDLGERQWTLMLSFMGNTSGRDAKTDDSIF